MAGIKNLETTAFRKDSPIRQTQSRFPEKYVQTNNPWKHNSHTNYSSNRGSNANIMVPTN